LAKNEDGSYDIGFRKPPKESQFTKGKSGNPAGRPKGAKSIFTILGEVGRKKIRVKTEKGFTHISMREAAAQQLGILAVGGKNLRAILDFLHLQRVAEAWEHSSAPSSELDERDLPVLEHLITRIREAESAASTDGTTDPDKEQL
jgi:hypothetical protein